VGGFYIVIKEDLRSPPLKIDPSKTKKAEEFQKNSTFKTTKPSDPTTTIKKTQKPGPRIKKTRRNRR
jgi:hypothetical protein